ncbi:hypothetical protein BAUCODRAFT_540920 [Baudoinia panamericana UAMH 10762]|uniref:CUE domain-containing protein n=1 Tax=Baudoinia panamericana (strain UAMH 10762) TaxID=717646 RepID=M2N9B8_BAUPA|nr:uncharacterized protein BAUCODRAFT_540920 [Baudoinia panamericana UAMH 10762]EMC95410.1 hypothetical protein BAUCODRAFT_540920 [Baudoinia panamericana UAMH 10762]
MSGQNSYPPPGGNQKHPLGSNNPYAHQEQSLQQNPWQDQESAGSPYASTEAHNYAPPPGPPPGQWSQQQQQQQQPRRTDTFEESAFVPDEERGEQREALEQFEMSKPQSQEDRDLETLQREFPSVDGSLIAALYGDSKSLPATREMLQELASSS